MRRCVLAVAVAVALAGCMAPVGQRYPVFFQEWSAQLDDGGNAVIAAAAARARARPDDPVIVTGFADPEGSPQANKDISRLRAQVVSDGLVADGVAAGRIQRRAIGAVDFSQTSQESRRVEVVVGTP